MILPIQITYRNLEPARRADEWIREEADKLDGFYNHIMGCRVVVELSSGHRRWGNLYHIRIGLTVPGGELVVKRQPSRHSSIQQTGGERAAKHLEVKAPHKELRQTINDAFKEMTRRLQDYARRQRGDVKTHELIPRARFTKLFPQEGYGFWKRRQARDLFSREQRAGFGIQPSEDWCRSEFR